MPKESFTTTSESESVPVKRKRLVNPIAYIAMKGFEGKMWKMMSEVRGQHDEDIVTHDPTGIDLIKNDGSKTYLVHSAHPDNLPSILADGLKFSGKYQKPDVPDLRHTTVMMAGPKERAARNRNIHDLAYRYGDEGSSIKLVYEFNQKILAPVSMMTRMRERFWTVRRALTLSS
jgi:hypothetical protein